MKIKIDKADKVFSLYIRERDNWQCQRCRRMYNREDAGSLHASHFWSRRHESTRFDPDNIDSLCFGCHNLWESDKQGDYRDLKIKQLGEKGYRDLEIRYNMTTKKDRKLMLIYWTREYHALCKKKGIVPKKI